MSNPYRPRVLAFTALALVAAPWARPDAATRGVLRAGGLVDDGKLYVESSLDKRLDALDFPKPLRDHVTPWEGGPQLQVPNHLEEHFTTVHYDRMKEQYFRPKPDVKRQPGKDFGHSINGVTGLITMPNSYILKPGSWSVGGTYENVEWGAGQWPQLYTGVDNDLLRVYLNRGFKGNFEAGLILHAEDADITYALQGTNTVPVRDTGDPFLAGLSFKGGIPVHDFLMSAGFTWMRLDDEDRQSMDLRSYENLQTAFLTLSNGGNRWEASVAIKYVKYATDGRRPPVGTGNGLQSGFSPTSQWTQIGIGGEYGKWGGLSLLGELTSRHRVDFIGVAEKELNLGLQWRADDFLVKVYSRRVNLNDTDHLGLSASFRFD